MSIRIIKLSDVEVIPIPNFAFNNHNFLFAFITSINFNLDTIYMDF